MGQSSASAAADQGSVDYSGGGLAALVTRASALPAAGAVGGIDRVLPVVPALRELLPGGGLRRGHTVAVTAEAGALVLALLARASAEGAWVAVVGMPALSPLAAAQMGLALERTALVPAPGPEWHAVVAALVDGVDVVVVAPPGQVSARVAGRITARARQQGCALVPCGAWEGADVVLTVRDAQWSGLGEGRGRLRHREVTVVARGRGAAFRPVEARLRLPDETGRPTSAPTVTGRPALRVVRTAAPADGRAAEAR